MSDYYSKKRRETIGIVAILSIALFYADVIKLLNHGTLNSNRILFFLSVVYFIFLSGISQEILDRNTFRIHSVMASLYAMTVFLLRFLTTIDFEVHIGSFLPLLYLAILYLLTNAIYIKKKSEIRIISYRGRSIDYKDKNSLVPVDYLNIRITAISFFVPPALLLSVYLVWSHW
jgi:predicted membrane channel-forming protein YqfA (hemolysin III family)